MNEDVDIAEIWLILFCNWKDGKITVLGSYNTKTDAVRAMRTQLGQWDPDYQFRLVSMKISRED